ASRRKCKPCRFVSKQSHSSPVILTASKPASGIDATSACNASRRPAGFFRSSNGWRRAGPLGGAALGLGPPMSKASTERVMLPTLRTARWLARGRPRCRSMPQRLQDALLRALTVANRSQLLAVGHPEAGDLDLGELVHRDQVVRGAQAVV